MKKGLIKNIVMRLKNLFYIVCLSFFVLISCSKDDPAIDVEGKIIFSKTGLPHFHIKDLKTDMITSYDALPHVSPSGTKVVMYNYQDILVTDFSGKQILYSYKPKNVQEIDFLWSPDDNKLAVLQPHSQNKLTIFDLDKKISNEVFMPANVSIIDFIVWPASDHYIYFMSKNNTNNQNYITRMKSDGSEFSHIFALDNDQTLDQAVDYSEASDLIIFTLFDSLSQESRICRISTSGTNFQTLYAEKTHGKYNFYRLKISPDGQKIIYEDGFTIYFFDILKQRKILWSNGSNPHWSSDGLVIMNSGAGGIQVKRLDQPDGEGNIIEVGMQEFFSWYFD